MFAYVAILTRSLMKYYLIAVLVGISLVTNDIAHLFMCLLAIFITPLEKCLFESFAYLKNWVDFVVEL